jgi:ClpX C4-type zinc finger
MGLDQELVREAERAKEHLAVAQHAAYRAKVDYHQSIRRLHTAGGSLREIAEALRLSHQRVHQIIDEAGEPTRRRREPQVLPGWMRLEPPGSEAQCSFCSLAVRQVRHLVAGGLPGAAGGKFGELPRICDKCLDLCLEILAETSPI